MFRAFVGGTTVENMENADIYFGFFLRPVDLNTLGNALPPVSRSLGTSRVYRPSRGHDRTANRVDILKAIIHQHWGVDFN
jgi:hypothetical protein